jgi:glycine betaine/choline ABC-type transport system substrate-binding protein
LAVSEEYIDNPTAFGNLPEFYGYAENMDNVTYEKMAIGTINYKTVANGDVDLGVGFATNPDLETMDLGTVEDDRNWSLSIIRHRSSGTKCSPTTWPWF